MKKFFLCLALLLCFFVQARAWDAEGHMLTAEVAYNHLNPVAKAKCDALIAVVLPQFSTGTSNFITAAAWADDFKTTLGTGIWHYIDIGFSLDGTPTNGVAGASFDVVRALHQCVTNLQDPNASLTAQATSLRYLIHFVGDIQQPLHSSTAVSASETGGDAGGNDFPLSSSASWTELHALWDAGGGFLSDSVGRPLSSSAQNTLNSKVALIEAAYPYNYTTNLNNIPDFMVWAWAGCNLARTNCYVGIANNGTPSTAYLSNAQSLTEQLMAQGGHRLADLLNSLYPSNIVMTVPLRTTKTNNQAVISWNSTPGNYYQVLWKTNLTDASWKTLTNFPATVSSTLFTDQVPQTQRFYRIMH